MHSLNPVLFEKFPAAQAKQAVASTALLYAPASQAVHVDDPFTAEYWPFEQLRQCVAAVKLAYVPAAHPVQTSGPVKFLYAPGAQALQFDASPQYPGMQMQLEMSTAPGGVVPKAGQSEHADAAVVLPYFPGGQR